jgi:hypothetical protein
MLGAFVGRFGLILPADYGPASRRRGCLKISLARCCLRLQPLKSCGFPRRSYETSLDVGAAVLSGDLAPPRTIIAAQASADARAAPTFSWVVAPPLRQGNFYQFPDRADGTANEMFPPGHLRDSHWKWACELLRQAGMMGFTQSCLLLRNSA